MPYVERESNHSVAVSEVLRGSLPPIDFLLQDFADNLSHLPSSEIRLDQVDNRIAYWRNKLAHDFQAHGSGLVYPHQDIMSVLLMDCMENLTSETRYLAERQKAKNKRNGFDDTWQAMEALGETQKIMLERIGDYDRIFANQPSALKFEGLRVILQEARCMVFDSADTPEDGRERDLLVGFLAEHKVLKGLREQGFTEQAGYVVFPSSINSDVTFKSDITVMNIKSRDYLDIQVKAGRHEFVVSAEPGTLRHIRVVVPMDAAYDRFDLAADHQLELAEHVDNTFQRAMVSSR